MTAKPSSSYRILLLVPAVADFESVKDQLNKLGIEYTYGWACSREEFEAATTSRHWDLIVCSCNIDGYAIEEPLSRLISLGNTSPVLVITNTPTAEEADKVFSLGTWDYVVLDDAGFLPWKGKFVMQIARFQERLARAEAKYSHLFDEVLDGLILIDEHGTILRTNAEALRQFGYSADEMVGHALSKLIPPEFSEEHQRSLDRTFEGDGIRDITFRGEFSALRKDGSAFPVEVFVRSMPEPDANLTIGRIRDISDRKSLEVQLSRTERFDALRRFAGNIAHDLNNALAPVMMSLELLRIRCPGELYLIDNAEIGATRAKSLLRELLSYSKGFTVRPERIDLRTLLTNFNRVMEPIVPKGIRFSVTVVAPISDIWGDPVQVMQVLTNLGHNALDAMPDGGSLIVSAEDIEVNTTNHREFPKVQPGCYVRITVTDTGHGIGAENLDKIFEPFFTTKGHEKGTGLGLSIVAGIVKSHNGYLEVLSSPDAGATFTVFLPCAIPLPAAGPDMEPSEAVPVAAGAVVLVVDDDRGVRVLVKNILSSLQFDVLTANDGLEALTVLNESHHVLKCVITDLEMPNMDGVALARSIREQWPNLGLIAMSGFFQQEVVTELREIGVHSLLEKPFTVKILKSAVSSLMGSQTQE